MNEPATNLETPAPTAAVKDPFGHLNAAQRRAATFGEATSSAGFQSAPLLIIAGAGTGRHVVDEDTDEVER